MKEDGDEDDDEDDENDFWAQLQRESAMAENPIRRGGRVGLSDTRGTCAPYFFFTARVVVVVFGVMT
jgi:hypothetical protein